MNFFAKKVYISIIKIFVIFNHEIDFIKRRKIKIEKIELFRSLLKCFVVFDNYIDNILIFLKIEKFWKISLKRITSNVKFDCSIDDNCYKTLNNFIEKLIEHIERKKFRIEKILIYVFFDCNIENVIELTWCFRFLFWFWFCFRKVERITFVIEIITNKKSKRIIKINRQKNLTIDRKARKFRRNLIRLIN